MEENWSKFFPILNQTSHLLSKKLFQFPPGLAIFQLSL